MCLALRYDASRSVDMKARAIASSDAMKSAISNLDPQASPEEIMDATQSSAFEVWRNAPTIPSTILQNLCLGLPSCMHIELLLISTLNLWLVY